MACSVSTVFGSDYDQPCNAPPFQGTFYGLCNGVEGNRILIGRTVMTVNIEKKPVPEWIKKGVMIKIEYKENFVIITPDDRKAPKSQGAEKE